MARQFGKYEILETLGEGGMGTVYKARQEGLDRLVALKVMRPDAASPEAFARFEREARILAQLRHPNIVRLLTMGRDETQVYFTMDFVEGRPLSALIEQAHGVAQSPSAVQDRDHLLRHVAVVARAVHYAHTQGIIHRDLKPTNVIVDRDGQPMITDFGLARELDAVQTVTAPGSAVGTALYISPEQAEGDREKIGPATDVYALGVILYEVLTGRPPFEGPTAAAILYKATTEPPVSPRRLKKRISRDLETICLKCLEKSPSDRYATAEALAIDLEQHLASRPIFALAPIGRRTADFFGRQRRKVGLLAVGTVLIAATLHYRITHPPPTDSEGTVDRPDETTAGGSDWPFEVQITSYHDPNDVKCVGASEQEAWWGIDGGVYRVDLRSGKPEFYPLGGATVRTVVRDSRGHWWFGAGLGLSDVRAVARAFRFDGLRWHSFGERDGLSCGVPRAAMIDQRRRVWFVGHHGASWYDGVRWRTHQWPYRRQGRVGDVFWRSAVWLCHAGLEANGAIKVLLQVTALDGPQDGPRYFVSRFDGDQWQADQEVVAARGVSYGYDVGMDARGRFWISTQNGVACLDDQIYEVFGKGSGLLSNDVQAIAAQPAGPVWVAHGDGVSRYDGTTWRTYTEADAPGLGRVRAIGMDEQDRTWFATTDGLLNLDGATWKTYPAKGSAMKGWYSPTMAFDPSRRIWLCSDKGVVCFDGTEWHAYRQEGGPPNTSVWAIAVDRGGRKWFGTDDGAVSYDGTTWRLHGPTTSQVLGLAVDDNDRKWLLTHGALYCLDGQKLTAHAPSDGAEIFSHSPHPDLAIDSEGTVWFPGKNGASAFDGSTWRTYTPRDGLAGEIVSEIAIDQQDRKWFATWTEEALRPGSSYLHSRGLSVFDGTRWIAHPMVKSGTIEVAPDGSIWVSVGVSLRCFNGRAWTAHEVPWPTRSASIMTLAFDTRGWKWVGSSGAGVGFYDGKTWRFLTTEDNLSSNTVIDLAVDLDGSIWVGTSRGISHIVLKRKG